MKKILAVAVAAAIMAPLAASADTTIYGRVHTDVNYIDSDGSLTLDLTNPVADWVLVAPGTSYWDVKSQTTRIGIKGSEDLGNGLKAIFQAEWAFGSAEGGSTVAGDLANRLAYAGLSGSWGTAAIGRQWTPYYGAVDVADIMNHGDHNPQYLGPHRTGNAIAYVTPDFSGFVAKAAIVVDGGDAGTANNDVDAINASVEYNNGPLKLGLGYHDAADDESGFGLSGKYNFGMFAIFAQYEDFEDKFGTKGLDANEWTIGGEANFGNNKIYGLYGNQDWDSVDGDTYAIGAQHSFSKKTRVYAEYGQDEGAGLTNDGQTLSLNMGKVFSLGLRHDF
ncbi:MAG: porin [Hyphomicrobiales bacterium]|nr:porin [Hyphomicrobiales bacterium]